MKRSIASCVALLLLALTALASGGAVAGDPASAYALATDRVIVRLKGGDPVRAFNAAAREALASRLSAQSGEAMRNHRVMGDGAQVMKLSRRMTMAQIAALSKRFANDSDVIEILPDRIFFPAVNATDPLFAQQWALSAASGINAPAAWDITTGANSLVVAIVDTGKLPHNDLAGRWVGGYDFVDNTDRSNDIDGRDADASDPGDWVTTAERGPGQPLEGCPVTDSSWHGTAMAGVIAANANNAAGIAGINWNAKLLPVRVVGKCGAFESDIADGIRWAVGIAVPGVPANADAADLINLSLSTAGGCSATLQNAINEVLAAGAPIIVAAGNNSLDASGYSPGNCTGVITVGAVDRNGGKPTYTNFGGPIALAAPGGIATIASGTAEDNWVLTTQNQGTTTPSANNDYYQAVNGTSIATAHVTGIASLMLSVSPTLTPAHVKEILQGTARTFPTNTVALGSQADCTTALCGSGIAAAAAAVARARDWGNATSAVTGGSSYAHALRFDGSVFAWGANFYGQLGTGDGSERYAPAPLASLSGIVQLAAGAPASHALAVRADGGVWTWGGNSYGQLGDGTTLSRSTPQPLPGLTSATRVARASGHSLALLSDGTVRAWGRNFAGLLGDGTSIDRTSPVQVSGLANVVAIAAESSTSYALKSDGSLWAWGFGYSSTPSQVSPGPFASIAAGSDHLVLLRTDGTVAGLGSNSEGQIGDGTFVTAATPQTASGLSGIAAIAAGGNSSYALTSGGVVWAWGNNSSGQLGDGTTTDRGVPVRVLGLTGVLRIGAGELAAYAVKPDGSVWAWGYNGSGALGNGASSGSSASPVRILGPGGTGFLDLGVADRASFAPQTDIPLSTSVTSNAIVVSGIANDASITVTEGQYSVGCTATFTSDPGTIDDIDSVCVRQVSAATCGTTTTTTLTIAGFPVKTFAVTTIACDTTPDAFSFTPQVNVAPGTVVTSNTVTITGINGPAQIIVTGGTYSIGCTETFTSGDGTITNGQTVCVRQTASPSYGTQTTTTLTVGNFSATFNVTTSALNVTRAIAGGTLFVHALRSDGTLFGWGANYSGQLGLGDTTSRMTPAMVSGVSAIERLGSGARSDHALAVRSDATAWAWGANSYGQLGDGLTVARTSPWQVAALSGVTKTARAFDYSFAIKSDGTLWAWGDNFAGKLGDGTSTDRFTPVQVSGLTSVVDVAAAGFSGKSYALKSDGTLWAWGSGYFSTPSHIVTGSTFSAIAGGASHIVLLKADGTVWGLGSNNDGQLGNGTTTSSSNYAPVQVTGLTGAIAVAAAGYSSYALRSDGTVWSWGDNGYGQLGDGTTSDRNTPVQVVGITGVAAIGAGERNGYAIKPDGSVWAWGSAGSGALGNNSGVGISSTPLRVLGPGAVGYLDLGVADPTSFAPQTDVALSTQATSNAIVVSGISNGASISVSGGTYSIGCTATFTSANGTIDNGQSVCVRQTSAATCATTTTTTLTIAGFPAKTFNVTTLFCDTTPDPFSFTSQTNVARGAIVTSNTVTISGINGPAQISVSGGDYSIGCTTFTSNTGTIANGQTVCVRQTASGSYSTQTTATLTIGGVSAAFNVTTLPPPNFTAQSGVPMSTQVTSNTVTVTGIANGATISVTGGDYSVGCTAVFTSTQGAINDNETVCVRQTSSPSCGTTTTTTLTITGFPVMTFAVTTVACDTAPDPFSFATQEEVARGSTVVSNTVTISGINTPTTISVVGGEYGIGCTGFTSTPDNVTNGQTVCVRQVASSSYETLTTATLTVGSASAAFHVVTVLSPTFSATPMMAGGEGNVHALRSDGSVLGWGDNAYGKLGIGDMARRYLPVAVTGVSRIVQLSLGSSSYHVLAVRADGRVWSWGLNADGQLGDGTTTNRSLPQQVPGLTGVTRLARGHGHTLALKADGTVWSWGDNFAGCLGDGTTTDRSTPAQIAGLASAVAVATVSLRSQSHALLADGSLRAWGFLYGTTPVPRETGSTFAAISGGGLHLMLLKPDGTVWGMGSNVYGQLGTGTFTDSSTAIQAAGLTEVTAIAAGGDTSYALKSDGTVWAWGRNNYGQVGDGTTTNRGTPVQVAGLTGIVRIGAGARNAYAVKPDGSVWAWGEAGFGALGSGASSGFSAIPVRVLDVTGDAFLSLETANVIPTPFAFTPAFGAPLGSAVSSNPIVVAGLGNSVASPITVTGGHYSVNGGAFISSAGTVMNGDTVIARVTSAATYSTTTSATVNIGGSLGHSSTFHARTQPDPAAVRTVPQVAAGDSHTYLLTPEGTVFAAGYNGNGQLGNGTTLGLSSFRPMAGLSGVVSIASGAFHGLALRADGSVAAWGSNSVGQLGHNSTNTSEPYFVIVPGLAGVAEVAGGQYHSLALKGDGAVWAWGLNAEGQVGDGSSVTTRGAPVQVLGINGVTAIAAGGRHNLALLADGTVRAWGANENGQLGDGSTTQRNSAVAVSGLSNVIAIAAGAAHSLAIKNDGSVVAWGFNGFGQLGDGTTINRLTPVPVSSLGTGVGLIAAGANHSLAVKAGGAMYSWGNNANSQLGNGNNTNATVPTLLSVPTAVVAISGGARHSAAIDSSRKLYVWGDNFFGQVGNRSGNYNPHSASLNVLRGDSVISEGTSGSGSGVGTGSNSGSSVLEIDGQATSFDFGSISAGGVRSTSGKYANQSASENITGISLAVTGDGFNLQGHDCPATLNPSQECNFTVAFNPASAATYSGELVVTSSVVGSPERRSLLGTGVANAAIAFAKTGADFPPQTVGTSSSAASLVLTNTGNATLSVSSVTSSVADFSATHDCGAVAPGGSCALSITFTPTAPNSRTGYLTIASNASGTPHTVTVSGTGVATQVASYALTVSKAGNGAGTVTSNTGGINCGATCSANYTAGTPVTLTATAAGGSIFSGWSGGVCSGTGPCQVTVNAPLTVTATFTAATVPGAPQNLQGTAGNGQATFTFSPPASNGGSAITGYTVTCSPSGSASAASSPITITGLANGTQYACSATASNAIGAGAASNSVTVTPLGPVTLTGVVSRKAHASAGTFDLPIDTGQAINGAITVEPRAGTHKLVFQFNGPVVVAGAASCVDANAQAVGSASAAATGNTVEVTLIGIPDNQRVTVSLANVNNASSASASMGFLVGDVNGSRTVTASDILRAKGRRTQAASASNFIYDIDRSGVIDDADVAAVKERAGLAIP